MKDTLNGAWSYGAAGISMLTANVGFADCWQFLMATGSAVLLIARLYVDVPRALARWRKRHER